jgi:hypothetical protein
MQRLGSNRTALTYALMTDDRATVQEQAAAIAAHAPISEAEPEPEDRDLLLQSPLQSSPESR